MKKLYSLIVQCTPAQTLAQPAPKTATFPYSSLRRQQFDQEEFSA